MQLFETDSPVVSNGDGHKSLIVHLAFLCLVPVVKWEEVTPS